MCHSFKSVLSAIGAFKINLWLSGVVSIFCLKLINIPILTSFLLNEKLLLPFDLEYLRAFALG
jgi:hypothetical protein